MGQEKFQNRFKINEERLTEEVPPRSPLRLRHRSSLDLKKEPRPQCRPRTTCELRELAVVRSLEMAKREPVQKLFLKDLPPVSP